ncbi:sugar transferase [Antarctobacter sp.]|uniref:sugar transferase n=1 Tax=Antarctobacter sp. TaxID=1872577 RepID=UPI003A906AC0
MHAYASDSFTSATPVAAPLRTRPVLGLPLVDGTTDQAIATLMTGGARRVYFLNAHCANVRARNSRYAAALDKADMVLPDGIGVELAARMTGKGLTENLNGTDFTPALLRAAAARGQSVFLFGAAPGTAEAAANRLALAIPGLRIAGTRDGFEGAADSDAAIDHINGSGADILLVALGVPMQELWIDEHAHRLSPRLVLGVGALFDFLADRVRRAPVTLRRAKMEWLWRLAMEPRRLAGRYVVGNVTFLARAAAYAAPRLRRDDLAKRAFDAVASAALILCAAPLLLMVALLIRLDSRGPVLFRQVRVGENGAPFTMYKFRSMHVDAEARRAEVAAHSDRDGLCFKARHDPRVTRIGRVLRRYSLDELPQILNVLRGDMSLVGPRPALPSEAAAYPVHARERLDAKPGITGLWQVSGRADIGFDKMVDLDVAYVRSRSMILDLLLLAMTARAVVSGRGAY